MVVAVVLVLGVGVRGWWVVVVLGVRGGGGGGRLSCGTTVLQRSNHGDSVAASINRTV